MSCLALFTAHVYVAVRQNLGPVALRIHHVWLTYEKIKKLINKKLFA